MADTLADQGRMPELVARAAAGDQQAARKVWTLLPDPPDDGDRPDW